MKIVYQTNTKNNIIEYSKTFESSIKKTLTETLLNKAMANGLLDESTSKKILKEMS